MRFPFVRVAGWCPWAETVTLAGSSGAPPLRGLYLGDLSGERCRHDHEPGHDDCFGGQFERGKQADPDRYRDCRHVRLRDRTAVVHISELDSRKIQGVVTL